MRQSNDMYSESKPDGRRPRPPKIDLGKVLPCTVVRKLGGRRFEVESLKVPRGWRIQLESKNPGSIREGEHTDFWVVRVDPQHRELLVRDGKHGRLPITESMRHRYLHAIRALIEPESFSNEDLLEALAEAKGMLLRITKQDSADWLSVYQLLGNPRPAAVAKSVENLADLRAKLKEEGVLDQDLLERASRPFFESLDKAIAALTYVDRAEADGEPEPEAADKELGEA